MPPEKQGKSFHKQKRTGKKAMKIDFCNGWTYRRTDRPEQKKQISVPHDAMLSEERRFDSRGGKNIGWYEGADYQYEKEFEAPDIFPNQTVFLEFEGVYHDAELFLNGKQAGRIEYGYQDEWFCVDGLLQKGKNRLTVTVHNSAQPNSRWYTGTGIYRPVFLHVLPEKHFERGSIRITTVDWKKRKVRIDARLSCPGEAEFWIMDGENCLTGCRLTGDGAITVEMTASGAKLWSCDCPKRYTMRAVFGEDEVRIPFGIRTVTANSEEGFCLNGERIILKGACVHHDNGILGASAYPDAEARKVRILKKAGYNALRSAHNPCSKALLDACDAEGMLVMDEYVDVWYIHKTMYDYAGSVEENYIRDLAAMVRKDYNHPSVVLYSLGNEVAETGEERGISLCGRMRDYLHDIDNTRPVTCGVNLFFNFLYSMGFGVYSDEKAQKTPEKEVGSAFFNKMATVLGDSFMKFGATLPGSDAKTRDSYSKMDIAGYNYGIWRYGRDVKKYPDRVILGTETFCADAALFWKLANRYPAVIGDFVWPGMSYHGEVPYRGWEKRDGKPVFVGSPNWAAAGGGRVDLNGREWSEADYTKVAFGQKQIAIGVVPVNLADEKFDISAWNLTCAMGSWSWNGCEGKKTRVEVYARAHLAELFLNGRSLGRKKLKNCRCVFNVTYRPGTLKAVAYTKEGKVKAETALVSAGEDTRLTAEVEEGTKDLYFVNLRYTDGNGMLKPLAQGEIHVGVQGGELLALGSARPLNPRSYLTDRTDVYYGEALAVIRPKGPAKLYAESPYGTQEVLLDRDCKDPEGNKR